MLDLPLSVNITVAEIGPDARDSDVDAFLTSPGGAGTQLCLELTERAMLAQRRQRGPRPSNGSKARGIGLALDDFGVGYSSLAHLHRLPVDVVKLDRAFLASVPTAGSDFMAAVVELCAALDLQVIAEGVETYEQHQVVRSVGITWAQGFFYAEPERLGGPGHAARRAQPAPPEHEEPGSGAVSAPT